MKKILFIVMFLAGAQMILNAGSEIELLEQACDGGYSAKCYDLGVIYREGRITDQDTAKAKRLFQKACDDGDPRGCTEPGIVNKDSGRGDDKASQCPRQEFKKYAEKLDKSKIESIQNLKEHYGKTASQRSKQCRSMLFSDFRKYYHQMTKSYIESAENSLNETYPLSPKKEKQFTTEFNRIGLRIYQSEGAYYIESDSAWFSKEFADSLPEAWQKFLKQSIYEEKNRFLDDAAVIVPWDDLRKRVVFWEKFLDDYPDFVEKSAVKKYISLYISTYLRGSDNSPIYDWETRVLRPEVKKSYENFIKLNGDSKYYDMVKSQYAIIKSNAFKINKNMDERLNRSFDESITQIPASSSVAKPAKNSSRIQLEAKSRN